MAIGANCFNMGVVMPWVGYWIYKLIKGNSDNLSTRAVVAAFIAGYVGLNAAAFITALEFGSQYNLFQAADGTPLYFPYSIKVAVAALMSAHLLLAGPGEGLVTAMGAWFVSKNYPALITQRISGGIELIVWGLKRMFKNFSKLWLALGAFILLSPLGLIATGTAFGEWGLDQLPEEVGFVPDGLAKFADLWTKSPLPDYGVPGLDASFMQSAGGYILSALVGVVLIIAILSVFSKIVKE